MENSSKGKSEPKGFAYWFGADIPNRGSLMFLQAAFLGPLAVTINTGRLPSTRLEWTFLIGFSSLFLLLALAGRIWECRVHREILRITARHGVPMARHLRVSAIQLRRRRGAGRIP